MNGMKWRSPNNDRGTFFLFFIGGVLSILILKGLTGNQILATIVPCLLMLFYAARMWDFKENQPGPNASGDNLYYLGFLYTLTSLGHSLYHFNRDETGGDTIVTNFGIAISTTILGMALRVLVGPSTVDDPAALDESARLDLAETTRRLSRELSYVVDSFHDSLKEDLDGVRKRLAEEAERAHDINLETVKRVFSLSQQIAQLDDAIAKTVTSLVARAQELDRSAVDLKAFEESLQELGSRAVEAIDAIEQRADALTTGAEKVRNSLHAQAELVRAIDFRKALLDSIEVASQEVKVAVERMTSDVDHRIQPVFLSVEDRLETLKEISESIHKSLQDQQARIAAIDFRQLFLENAIEPASSELRAAALDFKAWIEAPRQMDTELARALTNCEKAVTALHESLSGQQDIGKSILNALEDSRNATNSLQSASEKLVTRIESLDSGRIHKKVKGWFR